MNIQSTKPATRVYLFTFLASMMISALVVWQDPVINKDGILYVDVARQFIDSGLSAAFATFNWPLYGILIGLVHQTSGLPYEYAAHLLNAVLVAIACLFFVKIYASNGQSGTRPWIAALLVLSLPIVNDYRAAVIRDYGFWAFSMVGLHYFVRFVQTDRLVASLAWQVALLIAIGFRIEGAVFSLAPIVFYLTGRKDGRRRIRGVLRSTFVFIALGLAGLALLPLYTSTFLGSNSQTLGLWLSYISPAAVFGGLMEEAVQLRGQLEYLSSTNEALLVLVFGLFSLMAVKVLTNAVPAYLLVAAYGTRQRWIRGNQESRIVGIFLLLSLFTLLAIVGSRYFLSSRYTVTAVLLLSLLTFQHVDYALHKLQVRQHKRWVVTGGLLILVLFLDGIISLGESKLPLKTGAIRAAETIPAGRPCLCNESRLQFYSQDRCTCLAPEQIQEKIGNLTDTAEGGYLLLWVGRKDIALQQVLKANPQLQHVQADVDRKGSQVALYRITAGPAGE